MATMAGTIDVDGEDENESVRSVRKKGCVMRLKRPEKRIHLRFT